MGSPTGVFVDYRAIRVACHSLGRSDLHDEVYYNVNGFSPRTSTGFTGADNFNNHESDSYGTCVCARTVFESVTELYSLDDVRRTFFSTEKRKEP